MTRALTNLSLLEVNRFRDEMTSTDKPQKPKTFLEKNEDDTAITLETNTGNQSCITPNETRIENISYERKLCNLELKLATRFEGIIEAQNRKIRELESNLLNYLEENTNMKLLIASMDVRIDELKKESIGEIQPSCAPNEATKNEIDNLLVDMIRGNLEPRERSTVLRTASKKINESKVLNILQDSNITMANFDERQTHKVDELKCFQPLPTIKEQWKMLFRKKRQQQGPTLGQWTATTLQPNSNAPIFKKIDMVHRTRKTLNKSHSFLAKTEWSSWLKKIHKFFNPRERLETTV